MTQPRPAERRHVHLRVEVSRQHCSLGHVPVKDQVAGVPRRFGKDSWRRHPMKRMWAWARVLRQGGAA